MWHQFLGVFQAGETFERARIGVKRVVVEPDSCDDERAGPGSVANLIRAAHVPSAARMGQVTVMREQGVAHLAVIGAGRDGVAPASSWNGREGA